MHAYIHKIQWIHRRQGDEVPKKIAILPDNGNVGLRVFPKFHDHTYALLYAHCSVSSHCLRLSFNAVLSTLAGKIEDVTITTGETAAFV